jgi:hypothetical protein
MRSGRTSLGNVRELAGTRVHAARLAPTLA